jgi:hypothetical protein
VVSATAAIVNRANLGLAMPAWLRFQRALRDPARAQTAILQRIVHENASTEFGRSHGFADIVTVDDWRERVPLRDYDGYAAWIRRIESGEGNVLTGEPVRFLEPTGGSSEASKQIPYTTRLMAEFSAATVPWCADLLWHRPRLRNGRAYWAVSPPVTRLSPPLCGGEGEGPDSSSYEVRAGVRQGMAHERDTFPAAIRWLLGHTVVTPSLELLAAEPQAWREITLRTLLGVRDLAFISVWSPSFLTLLVESLDDEDAGARWPQLDLISCWTDSTAARALERMRRRFPNVAVQGKGLLATEGVVSIPLTDAPAPVAAVTSHFLEFLDGPRAYLVHELEVGKLYEVVLTTGGGLYRYRLKDLVRVEGYLHRTPLLRFAGRTDGVIDLAGEKLSPAFVEQALADAGRALGVPPAFAMLAPAAGEPAGYVLYTDLPQHALRMAAQLDVELRQSHHYNLCRTLGQLAPVRVVANERAERIYHEVCAAGGQRVGVIKPRSLAPDLGWEAAFATTLEAVS